MGRTTTLTDAPFSPKPVGPLPLLVGTGSPRMLRLTARWADEWNTWGDPDEVARPHRLVPDGVRAVGRDPATVRRSAQAMVFLTDDRLPRGQRRSRTSCRTARCRRGSELIDQLARYVELGVDEFAIPDFTLGETPEERREALDTLRAEVLRTFRTSFGASVGQTHHPRAMGAQHFGAAGGGCPR